MAWYWIVALVLTGVGVGVIACMLWFTYVFSNMWGRS